MKEVDKVVAEELLRNELLLLDPAVRRDRPKVAALLAEDFFEFGSSGRIWTREAILDLLATEDYVPPGLEDFACCAIAEGVVLVTYRTVRFNPETGRRAGVLRSSIWTRSSSRWVICFHQGTPEGESRPKQEDHSWE
jgi:hypothetical protein